MQSQQLDLFEERTLRLARGRGALRALDLEAARDEFTACLARHPDDREAQEGLAKAVCLRDRLMDLQVHHGDPVSALRSLRPELEEALREGWHRRLALEAERVHGHGCYVDGVPAGLHWLLGGDLQEAERSLIDTLSRQPGDARTRGYLGDVRYRQGQVAEARLTYLQAFLDDPRSVDLERLADPEVAGLPSAAANEHEVQGDCLDWAAAVGTVEQLFPPPAVTLPGLGARADAGQEGRSPGRDFYRWLLEERSARTHEERVTARRQMKQLCPSLLAAYLRRLR